ncbi:MAG: hypothetical protein JJT99_10870 [Rhodobacteraceae bacterium]|nr:hypothetical protein [Paracoccaceae bacterium]
MSEFSDHIIYGDESGDHGLKSIDPGYPVFVLAFCVMAKADYTQWVVPAVQEFRFDVRSHDSAILHAQEIRKTTGSCPTLETNMTYLAGIPRPKPKEP